MFHYFCVIFSLGLASLNGFEFRTSTSFRATFALKASSIVKPVFESKCEITGITLTRYLLETVKANPQLQELESLVLSIKTACKAIANVVDRASLTGLTGMQRHFFKKILFCLRMVI